MIEVNESNFEHEVLQSKLPVVVDFYADYCGPCRMIKPALTLLAKEQDGQVKFVVVDVVTNANLVNSYGVSSVPTLLVIRDGKEVHRMVGLGSLSELRDALR
jgi:thioredoxin 1